MVGESSDYIINQAKFNSSGNNEQHNDTNISYSIYGTAYFESTKKPYKVVNQYNLNNRFKNNENQ